jgi:hypothetical protein
MSSYLSQAQRAKDDPDQEPTTYDEIAARLHRQHHEILDLTESSRSTSPSHPPDTSFARPLAPAGQTFQEPHPEIYSTQSTGLSSTFASQEYTDTIPNLCSSNSSLVDAQMTIIEGFGFSDSRTGNNFAPEGLEQRPANDSIFSPSQTGTRAYSQYDFDSSQGPSWPDITGFPPSLQLPIDTDPYDPFSVRNGGSDMSHFAMPQGPMPASSGPSCSQGAESSAVQGEFTAYTPSTERIHPSVHTDAASSPPAGDWGPQQGTLPSGTQISAYGSQQFVLTEYGSERVYPIIQWQPNATASGNGTSRVARGRTTERSTEGG